MTARLMLGGARERIDALNVFPVADGDTGTNMYLTMDGALDYVRGQFDAIEVRVPGAPAADEIVFILAMSTGYRVHARVGGLLAKDISKWDGLR